MSVIETFAQTIERLYVDLDDDALTNTPYQGEAGMTTPGSCCDGSCPEIADVTVEEVTFNIAGVTIVITKTYNTQNGPSDIGALLEIQLQDSDSVDVSEQMQLMLHFCDSPTDLGVISTSPPPTPGWGSKTVFTDEDGYFSLQIDNPTPNRIWYLIVACGGVVKVSDAIALGVP